MRGCVIRRIILILRSLRVGKTKDSAGRATMLCVTLTRYSPHASLARFRTRTARSSPSPSPTTSTYVCVGACTNGSNTLVLFGQKA